MMGVENRSGCYGRDIIISQLPDLILLDDMMSGLHGFKVCRMLRDNLLTKAIQQKVAHKTPSQGENLWFFT